MFVAYFVKLLERVGWCACRKYVERVCLKNITNNGYLGNGKASIWQSENPKA